MKTDDQIIYQKLGELLWSVMPNEAKEIKYVGMFYQNSSQAGTSWVDKLDTTHEISHFGDIANTHDVFPDYNRGFSVYGKDLNNLDDTNYTPALVKNRPDLAIKHADAFSYYIEASK